MASTSLAPIEVEILLCQGWAQRLERIAGNAPEK